MTRLTSWRTSLTWRGLFFVVAGLALAGASWAQIASNLAEDLRPDLAAKWWPGNDRALARLGEFALLKAQVQQKGSGTQVTSTDVKSLGEARGYARASLRASGLQSGAFRVLAIAALAEGDETESWELAKAAERLTRRDERIQLLLSRRALLDRRIAVGLRHVDLALRGDQDMRMELFPALATAVRDKEARPYFAPYMRANNPWLADFLVYALTEGPAPKAIGEMIAEAGKLPDRPGTSIEEIAVPRMVQIGEPVLARAISRRLPAAERPAPGLSNPSFSNDDQTVLPFGWSYSDRSELTIQLPRSRSDAGLTITSTGSFSAELAQQLLTLTPGSYRLDVVGAKLGHAHWRMTCSGSGEALLSEAGLGDNRFDVPRENCDGQWLRLEGDGKGVVDVELTNVSIKAAS